MNTLPLRQSKPTSRPQQPPVPKAAQSQPTIDLYLKPIAKVRQGQTDIRKYFPPVPKTKIASSGEFSDSRSPTITTATPEPDQEDDGVAKCQTPDPSWSLKPPGDSITSEYQSRQPGGRAPGVFVRARNTDHVKPAVPPRSDPVFDKDGFPRSTSPMAPRITDVVVRHSLVPKPLNIKTHPPAVEPSRSLSQTTCSPSSVDDHDVSSPNGERREVPSVKQTYLSVPPRQNTNDTSASPLTAMSDPSPKPLRQRMDRPTALRSNTAPKFLELSSPDSFKHILPKISPASESSVDEREPLMRSSYRRPMKKASTKNMFGAKRQAGKHENGSPVQKNRMMDALKDRDATVSPGMRTCSALTIEGRADIHRTPTILRSSCISRERSPYQRETEREGKAISEQKERGDPFRRTPRVNLLRQKRKKGEGIA